MLKKLFFLLLASILLFPGFLLADVNQEKIPKLVVYWQGFDDFALRFNSNIGRRMTEKLQRLINKDRGLDEEGNPQEEIKVIIRTTDYYSEISTDVCEVHTVFFLSPLKWLELKHDKDLACRDKFKEKYISLHFFRDDPYYSPIFIAKNDSSINEMIGVEEDRFYNKDSLKSYEFYLGPKLSSSSYLLPINHLWQSGLITKPEPDPNGEGGIVIESKSNHFSVVDMVSNKDKAIGATWDDGFFGEDCPAKKNEPYIRAFQKHINPDINIKRFDPCITKVRILQRFESIPNDIIVVDQSFEEKYGKQLRQFFHDPEVQEIFLAGLGISKFIPYETEHALAYERIHHISQRIENELNQEGIGEAIYARLSHYIILLTLCIVVRKINSSGPVLKLDNRMLAFAVADSLSIRLLLNFSPSLQLMQIDFDEFSMDMFYSAVFWGICVSAIPATMILQNMIRSLFEGMERGIGEINQREAQTAQVAELEAQLEAQGLNAQISENYLSQQIEEIKRIKREKMDAVHDQISRMQQGVQDLFATKEEDELESPQEPSAAQPKRTSKSKKPRSQSLKKASPKARAKKEESSEKPEG